jgi:hypothetical protein
LFARVSVTDSGSSSSFVGGTFTAFVLYVMTAGENWKDCRTGLNAVASLLRGDGSGVATFGPQ